MKYNKNILGYVNCLQRKKPKVFDYESSYVYVIVRECELFLKHIAPLLASRCGRRGRVLMHVKLGLYREIRFIVVSTVYDIQV